MLTFAALAVTANAEDIVYSKISAYINNYPIQCYNINDRCVVFARDLSNYGFDVGYNEEERIVNITRTDGISEITGMDGVKIPYQNSGAVFRQTGGSDIRVLLNGAETDSYWADGNMMILLDNMYPFGSVEWDADKRALFLKLDGISEREYAPIETAVRPYREKPETWRLDKDSYNNYPTEAVGWGFVRVEGDAPELYSWQISMIEKFNGYYMDRSRPHKLYLTFDEGYEAGYTPKILDTLEKYNVPAAFFVTGEFVDSKPDLVRRMIDSGFTVGNHTVNHKNLAKCDVGTVMNEIEVLSNRLRNEFGYDMHYMRPPEGEINERSLAIANDMGYDTILWSFAYYDYDENVQKGADYAYDMMTRYAHDGAIMLIHAVSKDNANALEGFINFAKEKGYEFASLDDLCNP